MEHDREKEKGTSLHKATVLPRSNDQTTDDGATSGEAIEKATGKSTDLNMIWILDNDPACLALYQQTLGLQYGVRGFTSVEELLGELSLDSQVARPYLLIADPENTKGSFGEALRRHKEANLAALKIPDFVIATRDDQLDLMRFYLKAGARDYILKPLRPNEIVAKIERAIFQISNREIFILRNDLDGVQIPDLTFREHQMLTIFLNRADRSVKRDDLYDAIWSKVSVNKKTLDVHLFNLRRKLRPVGYDVVCQGQVFTLCRSAKDSIK